MTSGIYGIYCNVNGRWYVGQSKDIEERIKDHYERLGGRYHHNPHLQAAWNKHGMVSFSGHLLRECSTKEDLDFYEKLWVFQLHAFGKGFNMTEGGDGTRGHKHSEETKQKISNALTGKPFSEETRQKISTARIGRTASRETREKLSLSLKGRPGGNYNVWNGEHSEVLRKKLSERMMGNTYGTVLKGKPRSKEHARKIGEAQRGRIISEETKMKMSVAKKGKPLSDEHRQKISEGLKRNYAQRETDHDEYSE